MCGGTSLLNRSRHRKKFPEEGWYYKKNPQKNYFNSVNLHGKKIAFKSKFCLTVFYKPRSHSTVPHTHFVQMNWFFWTCAEWLLFFNLNLSVNDQAKQLNSKGQSVGTCKSAKKNGWIRAIKYFKRKKWLESRIFAFKKQAMITLRGMAE